MKAVFQILLIKSERVGMGVKNVQNWTVTSFMVDLFETTNWLFIMIIPNFFSFFVVELGHFIVNTSFSFVTNTQVYHWKSENKEKQSLVGSTPRFFDMNECISLTDKNLPVVHFQRKSTINNLFFASLLSMQLFNQNNVLEQWVSTSGTRTIGGVRDLFKW